MRKAALFTFILCAFDSAFAATHSLRYVHTGTSGIPEFPEFVTVGLVDEEPFVYYDSNIRKKIPRMQWIEKSEGPDYWDGETQTSIREEQVFKANIETLKPQFNQTGGIHTFQLMYGCEWDDDTGTTSAHRQYGYDGEDYLALDFKTMRWVAPVPQAVGTKDKLDNNRALIEDDRTYFNQICIEWLKKYLDYGKETLQRKVRPEVSLLQKDDSSPVTCQVTGFFPKGVMVHWQKDGKEMHEDVEMREMLPNGDGTFQIKSVLKVPPEDLKNHEFSCVVDHISLEEKMVKKWVPGSNILPIIIGCVVVALLAICAVAAFVVWKKKNQGYGKTSTSDSDSDNSGQQAAKA